MAPRNSRGKKKKKEERVLPAVMDITVNLPDETHVILKGISTDRIVDVRRLLSVNTMTCSFTNFSLSHEVRGPRLKDTVDISALKPCTLALVAEDYDEATATAHVRRLLDILACTTCFGASPIPKSAAENPDDGVLKPDVAKSRRGALDGTASPRSPKPPITGTKTQSQTTELPKGSTKDVSVDVEGDLSSSCPKLGSFYEFFSLSHLTPPVQFIRRSVKQRSCQIFASTDSLFSIDVKLCNGKLFHIAACRDGFCSVGKRQFLRHNLVDLLRQLSRSFDNAYDDLMKAFSDRNKFGNLPYGFRANTWLTPPVTSQLPLVFCSLPLEDETWGGGGGGLGRDGKSDLIPWASEFVYLASMACKTAEERQIRDRRALLLHCLFVDIAILKAISAVRLVMGKLSATHLLSNSVILYSERVGDLTITVMKDASTASSKIDTKIDGFRTIGVDEKKLVERNLLKGITADENSTACDIATLGVVNVRFCGYIASVKVKAVESCKVPSFQSIELPDQPEGGANALNTSSLRFLLHKRSATENNKPQSPLQSAECKGLDTSKAFVRRLIEDSLSKLQEEWVQRDTFVRWELGACWIQHLKDQKITEKDKKPSSGKVKHEMKVEGLGTPLKIYKNSNKKSDETSPAMQSECSKSFDDGIFGETEKGLVHSLNDQLKTGVGENKLSLRGMLSDEAFGRLKQSETELHYKSMQELIDLVHTYYNEVALPKLVADFGSLELSPVDGRTLTDFMHTRGLRMRSLGQVVKLSEKLSHVQSLCLNEMIARAFKHVLQAVIAATEDSEDLAASIAAALNLMLGTPGNGEFGHSPDVDSLIHQWLKVFLMKRYEWDFSNFNYKDVRKIAILRELCNKVGIEIVPRDFDLDCINPFQKADFVSLVPVHKQAACSSADGRQLLETSKTALDKGKLDEAVSNGTKALAKLVAVCGPYHRMTAGAYSLLAVVLYHTGDFNQATIYQQKALDINERELGLDHPDTMKSYGDLAVFYYRLQHTELAIKYVRRALYLLHLICGPSHPNTAATYINVAMMEEGLGNVHVTLRYLHKALKCNQRLLGPDHIQTAATYHAIAIALSLMEAYPLSVQHEQTTLRILRAKLGPDDLRTQDAAAWLEYFESKAVEQQDTARNGSRKPDASIASKGHLSVSDLLDYINPISAAKGKNSMMLRRKNNVGKIGNFIQNARLKSLEESDKDVPREPTVEEDKVKPGPEAIVRSETGNPSDKCKISVECEPATDKQAAPKEVPSEIVVEEEDGWQPVQRPRSTVSHRWRVRQQQPTTINEVFNHQQIDANSGIDCARQWTDSQHGGYYMLKKRSAATGNYMEHHNSKSSSGGTKFGGKIVKAVTYRVKSAPSSAKTVKTMHPQLEAEPFPLPNEASLISKRTTVKLGKPPSYKEVALAPAGSSIATAVEVSHDSCPEDKEFDVEKLEPKTENCGSMILEPENIEVENHSSVPDPTNKLDVAGEGETESIASETEPLKCSDDDDVCGVEQESAHINGFPNPIDLLSEKDSSENGVVQESIQMSGSPNSVDSLKAELSEKDSTASQPSQDSENQSLASNGNDASEFAGKKLSASAAPFNPVLGARSAPIPMKIVLPSCHPPVPVSWTMNPMCPPSHHLYPSPPATPNMIHPLPFMYPPYSQHRAVSPSAFPITPGPFYRNQFRWSNTSEFVSSNVWPGCHSVEPSSLPPVDPVFDTTSESCSHCDKSETSDQVNIVTDAYVGSGTMDIVKEEAGAKSEDNNVSSEFDTNSFKGAENDQALGSSPSESSADGEKTFNILLRGRRNRKHNLRMPISLLSKPHSSHSFKLVHSRVIRGGESPRPRTAVAN